MSRRKKHCRIKNHFLKDEALVTFNSMEHYHWKCFLCCILSSWYLYFCFSVQQEIICTWYPYKTGENEKKCVLESIKMLNDVIITAVVKMMKRVGKSISYSPESSISQLMLCLK